MSNVSDRLPDERESRVAGKLVHPSGQLPPPWGSDDNEEAAAAAACCTCW